ncbi:hypothetical protein IWQ60_011565 [Tieghemiomyces parasiticus]|uniref:Uncharacterized protein n=1 Tax=Tieghemiomyces parasiticus TaxID=78921 RepID=A0A9W7ZMM4_9FUNG|nr:hypothetical protein IWQ60_011565 [Tieghemiomyces parasiticus]
MRISPHQLDILLLLAGAFLIFHNFHSTYATLTVTESGQNFLAIDVPRFGKGHAPWPDPYAARLIQLTVDEHCELTMEGLHPYNLTSSSVSGNLDRVAALVTPTVKCPFAHKILRANRNPTNVASQAILAAMDTLILMSYYNASIYTGGFNEDTTNYLAEFQPFDPAYLMMLGTDQTMALIGLLGASNTTAGLPVTLVHESSPWDRFYGSPPYLALRWSFLSINLVGAVFVAYHTIILILEERIVWKTRYIYRLPSCIFLLLHLAFHMACPLENIFTRPTSIIYLFGILFEYFAYILLIMQWTRVVYTIYHWRIMRAFFYFSIFEASMMFLMTVLLSYQVYGSVSQLFVDILWILQVIVIPTGSSIQFIGLAISAVLITRSQWGTSKAGSETMSFVKLTYFCTLSSIGWLLVAAILLLTGTVWSVPGINSYIVRSVCMHISSLLTASAIFWTLAVSAQVKRHNGTLATRTLELHTAGGRGGPGFVAGDPPTLSPVHLEPPSEPVPMYVLDSCDEDHDRADSVNEKQDRHYLSQVQFPIESDPAPRI